ncbi:DUF951 domain-containing protein [Selenomonas bovis]|uniref:DUF951 domain-containing protein n=1 Tax=Selenomonas bovis TaxID=416586 RepID=UPI003CFF7C84
MSSTSGSTSEASLVTGGSAVEKKSYELGDIVRMKKPHPCGANEWLIVRTGMDFRLKCQGCGHYVLLPRTKFERMARQLLGHVELSRETLPYEAAGEASAEKD